MQKRAARFQDMLGDSASKKKNRTQKLTLQIDGFLVSLSFTYKQVVSLDSNPRIGFVGYHHYHRIISFLYNFSCGVLRNKDRLHYLCPTYFGGGNEHLVILDMNLGSMFMYNISLADMNHYNESTLVNILC